MNDLLYPIDQVEVSNSHILEHLDVFPFVEALETVPELNPLRDQRLQYLSSRATSCFPDTGATQAQRVVDEMKVIKRVKMRHTTSLFPRMRAP